MVKNAWEVEPRIWREPFPTPPRERRINKPSWFCVLLSKRSALPALVEIKREAETSVVTWSPLDTLILPEKEEEPVPETVSLPVLFREETVTPPAVRDFVTFNDPAKEVLPVLVRFREEIVNPPAVIDLVTLREPVKLFDPVPVNAITPPL